MYGSSQIAGARRARSDERRRRASQARSRDEQHRADHDRERDRRAEVGLERGAAAQKTHVSSPTGRQSSFSVCGAACAARGTRRARRRARASRARTAGTQPGRSSTQRRAPLIGVRDHEHGERSRRAGDDERRRERRAAARYSHRDATIIPATPSTAYVPCRSRYDIGFAPPTPRTRTLRCRPSRSRTPSARA